MCFDTNKRPLYVCKGTVIQVVTISFYRFDTRFARLWAFAMMGFARMHFARLSSLQFWKLCGSGTGEGFTPLPNTAVYQFYASGPISHRGTDVGTCRIFDRYQRMSAESWTIYLGTTSVRGGGLAPLLLKPNTPFPADRSPLLPGNDQTLYPDEILGPRSCISDVIGTNPDVMFKIGIGEVHFFTKSPFLSGPTRKAWLPLQDGMVRMRRLFRLCETVCGSKKNFMPVLTSLEHRAAGTGMTHYNRNNTMPNNFPFSAIVGQDQMKQAMILTAIDPTIGGVLVFGDRGTGKSTAVRALAAFCRKFP